MDPSLGIMAAALVICGGLALFVDDRRRSLEVENKQLREALGQARRDPLERDAKPGGWVPSKRHRVERLLVGGRWESGGRDG